MQTRTQSAIEVVCGTLIGFVIALLSQIFITNLYGIPSSIEQDVWITSFFTCISIIRNYAVRRFFNHVWRLK